jgi:hypothetical protein
MNVVAPAAAQSPGSAGASSAGCGSSWIATPVA